MRVLALIFSGFLLAGADDRGHPRIVSTSLCGDAYVLSMIAHENIAALSWQSGDKLSNAPQSLRHTPKTRDDAEILLALAPTLVVFGPGEGITAKPLLDKAKIKYVSLQWGEDFKTITANRKMLNFAASGAGSNLGKIQSDAGTMSKKSGVKILYLSASGATAGPGTYIDAAIRRAGGINIMTTPGWHTPDIEALVGLEPDLVITSFFKDGYASVNGAGLNNKVLQDKISKTAHVNVPGKLWPCAGPGLYAATDIIAKAVEGLR